MAEEEEQNHVVEAIPGIHEVNIQTWSENFGLCVDPGGLSRNGVGDFDIKRMEEHATELEKDLIVKELETLDVLEALGSTKRIVEDLKRQLHQEFLRSAEHLSSDIEEMNDEHCNHNPLSSSDLILMELKQAKINLGKTMDDLVMI